MQFLELPSCVPLLPLWHAVCLYDDDDARVKPLLIHAVYQKTESGATSIYS